MKDYKITIDVSKIEDVYSLESFEKAEEIAESLCDEIYARLKRKCRVKIESIEEINIEQGKI